VLVTGWVGYWVTIYTMKTIKFQLNYHKYVYFGYKSYFMV
jgi:hypothetical protein